MHLKFVCIVLLIAPLCLARQPPPIYSCEGTFFECGVVIGTAARETIQYRLTQKDLIRAMGKVKTAEGSAVLKRYMENLNQTAPYLVEELQGLAKGSGTTYDNIMLLNALDEFGALETGVKGTPQCTDVMTNSNTPALAHNEDNVKWTMNTTYIVNLTHVLNGVVVEKFVAYAYAGTMGGNYFGFNHHGLTFSDNFIFGNSKNFDTALPTNLANRLTYMASSMQEVILMKTRVRGGTAHNINVGSTFPNPTTGLYEMFNFEADPVSSTVVHEVYPMSRSQDHTPFYAHTNVLLLLNVSQYMDPSSLHRLTRLNEMAQEKMPMTGTDLTWMLGDTTDPVFPVYRDGTAADDDVMTLATCMFDLKKKTMSLWVRNPRSAPDMVLPIW